MRRARAWSNHHFDQYVLEADMDGDFICPSCGGYSTDEAKQILCCYEDGAWIEFCKEHDIPVE
jgi:hypothetical protein